MGIVSRALLGPDAHQAREELAHVYKGYVSMFEVVTTIINSE